MTPELVLSFATLVTAVGAVVVGWRNSQKADQAREKAATAADAALVAKAAAEAAKIAATQSQAEIIATKDGVFEVGKAIDGRLTELLSLTRESAYAEGRLAGRPEQS